LPRILYKNQKSGINWHQLATPKSQKQILFLSKQEVKKYFFQTLGHWSNISLKISIGDLVNL